MDFTEAVSSYQNSFGNWNGLGTYGGVELRDLADLVGGMAPGDVMTVTAVDGYKANFTYYQVYADQDYLDIQGQIILAYEYNGSVMDEEDRPMIAVLAPDEAFSNDDFNATCSKDPEFLSLTAAGPLWVKNVEAVAICELYEEWTVNLTDLDNVTTELTRTDFVRLAYFNTAEWTDGEEGVWSGATLSSVLGLIDDDDPATFNETIADTEYQIQVMASDDYNRTFIAKYLVENETVLANMFNGTILGADDAPLRIVGDNMTGGQMVSMVASITMLPPAEPDVPEDIVLTIEGTTTVDFTLSELQELTSYTSMGGFIKSTGTVVGPDEYTGAPLKDLVGLVWSGGEYYVQIVSTDNYTATFNYSQAENGRFEHFDSSGVSLGYDNFTMVVAYAQDGLPLVDMVLRIAIIDDNEPITNSSYWAKMVQTVKVFPFFDFSVTLEGKAGETETVDYIDLEEMDYVEAVSSYQNRFDNWRGLGTYGGVELRDLADLVGGMAPGDIMTVTAVDGYKANFTYYQVYADQDYLDIQGQIILAYVFNGSIMDEEDRPMTAVLAPDGAFSNDDFDATCSKDPEFLSLTSASSLWVKTVNSIVISALYEEWTIDLVDLDNATTVLTRTDFVRLAYFNSAEWVDGDGGIWSGATLSSVLGLIDDDDPTTYNEALADTEYQINVMASDGWNKTFIAKYLVENGTLLANMFNGTALGEEDAPLRIVGENMTGGQMVSMITSVTMLPPLVPEPVVLTVEGTTTVDFTLSDLQEMTSYTSMGGFIKSTGTIVGPDEYTGVPLKDLVDLVWSGGEYSVEVVSTDMYTMTFNYSQVEDGLFEHFDISGTSLGFDIFTLVVAYAQDGLPLVDMDLRMAIIDDIAPITSSELWAKMVWTVRIVPFIEEWTLELNGTVAMDIDRQTFEAIASCDYHQVSWSFENETGTHIYTGVALWILVSAVDGADGPEGEFSFNDLLAFAGYSVRVTASDGYNKVFTSMQAARNDSIIVANRLDGEPLPDDEWPLRIVGNWLSGSMKVGQVVNISLENLQPVPDWELTLVGTRTIVLSARRWRRCTTPASTGRGSTTRTRTGCTQHHTPSRT